jgi:hypothetical protein
MNPEGIDLARIIAGLPHSPLVYFLRTGNMVKIGTSTRLLTRVNDLSLSLADVTLVVPGGEDVERAYHARFARQRVRDRREWFWISGPLLTFLSDHKPVERAPKRVVPILPEPESVGLRDACSSGILAVSIESARAARKRDPGFPAPVGRYQSELLYRPAELAAWERNRPRGYLQTA